MRSRTTAWLALGLAGALTPVLAQQGGATGGAPGGQGTPAPNTNQPTPGQQDPQADQGQQPNTNQPTPGQQDPEATEPPGLPNTNQPAPGQGTQGGPRTPAQESENPFSGSTLDDEPRASRRLNYQPVPRAWERQRIDDPAGRTSFRDEWVITTPEGMRREPPVTGDPPVTAPPPDTGARPFQDQGPRVSIAPLSRRTRGFDAWRRGLLTDWTDEQGQPLRDEHQNVIVRREGDTEVRLVEQSGAWRPRTGRSLDRAKVVSGWVRQGDDAWEVRLIGEPEQVDRHRDAFLRWLDTVDAGDAAAIEREELPSPPGPP